MRKNNYKKYLPLGLSLLASAGVIATGFLSYKAGQKIANNDGLLTKEKLIIFTPPILLGGITVFCITAQAVLTRNQQILLASSYMAAKQHYIVYRNSVIEELGEYSDQLVFNKQSAIDLPSDKVLRMLEPISGEIFEATEVQILDAAYKINKTFALRGYVLLNEWFRELGLPNTDYGDYYGWSYDNGYVWLDFVTEEQTVNGETTFSVRPSFDVLEL